MMTRLREDIEDEAEGGLRMPTLRSGWGCGLGDTDDEAEECVRLRAR